MDKTPFKLPLRVVASTSSPDDDGDLWIVDGWDNFIASSVGSDDETRAELDYIAHAATAHAKLVEALQECRDDLAADIASANMASGYGGYDGPDRKRLEPIDAALALAKGGA